MTRPAAAPDEVLELVAAVEADDEPAADKLEEGAAVVLPPLPPLPAEEDLAGAAPLDEAAEDGVEPALVAEETAVWGAGPSTSVVEEPTLMMKVVTAVGPCWVMVSRPEGSPAGMVATVGWVLTPGGRPAWLVAAGGMPVTTPLELVSVR